MKSPLEIFLSFFHSTRPLTPRGIGGPRIRAREAFGYVLVFALMVATVGVFLRWHIAHLHEQEMASWRARVSGLADDRAHSVSGWLTARQADAHVFAALPSVRAVLRAHYEGGQFPKYPSAGLSDSLAVLDEMATSYSYAGVYILDRDAHVVVQSSRSIPLDPLFAETCRAVAHSGVMRIDLVGDAPHRSLIGFSAPVFPAPGANAAGRPPGQMLGIVLVVSDASQTLFPLVTRDDIPTRTGETLLARSEGNDIVFFSPLRHVPAGSQYLRLPFSSSAIPARLALEGRETFGDYDDYRGVPVLATTQNIPLTGWGLVRKIDRAEALEDFRRMTFLERLAAGLLVILLGGMLLFFRRYVVTRVRKQEEEQFRALLESAPDAMVVVNKGAEIVLLNLQAEKQFGYGRDELVGKNVKNIIPEGFAERLVADALRSAEDALAQQIGMGIELIGRRKDGSDFPIEIMLSPLKSAEGILVTTAIRDISARKDAEEHLVRMESRYRGLLEAVPDAIYIIEPSTLRILGRNRKAAEMDGYNDQDITHMTAPDFHPPEDHTLLWEKFERGSETGRVLPFHALHHRRKDGQLVPVEESQTLVDAGGERLILSVSHDITERKRAEEELHQSRQMLKSVLDTIPQRVFWKDRDTVYLGCNKAFAIDAGLKDPAEIIGKTDYELAWRETAEAYRADDKLVMEQDTPRLDYEEIQHRPDGSLIWLRTSKLPLHDREGKLIGMIGTYEDITERRKDEAERMRLMTGIEQAAEGVVITDAKGDIQYVNPAFSAMTGYSREEALGKNPRILKSGKHDAAFYVSLWATLLAGQAWRGEIINRRKDGSLYTEKMSITPVHDEHGKMTHIVAMKEDITARKLLEDQFRQAQKMEAVGRLAAGVAHDFNNLLTIILGYSDVMLDRFVAGDPMRGYTTEIKGAGERAVGLTRQLLAFSRQQVLAAQVLDLNTLISNLAKMLRRFIGEDIQLVFEAGPLPSMVKADPGQIEQVLMNLAVNSRDAMPQGGKLTIEASHFQVDEAYSTTHFAIPVGPYIMLAVSDTGCGMNKDIQAHIFEPFFTTKEQGKGTGLGLATVYGIVKQSGGYIWVYSEPGAGTTFKIYLPAVTGPLQAAQESAVPAGGSETVLLVEDDASLRELARMVLVARGGYKVLESPGGKEARLFAGEYKGPIHLLLTDVVMPGMSGRELSEELAALRPEMKILYMSGYTDDTVVRHGVLEEGMAFLQKPFTAESLLRKVRDVLDTRRQA